MAEKTEFKTVETSQEDLEELEEKIKMLLQIQKLPAFASFWMIFRI